MSNSRNISREMVSGVPGIALQKEREREKKRRELQLVKQEDNKDEPVFSQPRKVSTARQDSLTRNINSVLGDPNVVTDILFKEPNIWLGTSRSSQGPPTPAPAPVQSQDDSAYYPNLNQQNPTSTQKSHSSFQKRASTASFSSSNYNHGSKQPPPPAHQSNHSHRNPSSASSHSFNKSRDDTPGRSHLSSSKQTHESFGRHRQSNQTHFSTNAKPPKSEQTHKSGPVQSTFNSSHLPIVQKSPRIPHHSDDKVTLGLKVELPAGVSERDRVSSVDSDMPGGVETIFKEMVSEQVEPISEIKTPIVGDSNFNFLASKRKPAGPESSLESSNTDVLDGDPSESDSSDDDTTDEDEEDDTKVNWNLSSWTAPQQQPPNPPLSSGRGPGMGNKTPRESPSSHSRKSEEKSRSQDWPKQSMSQGDSQSSGRGRRPDKKGSVSKNSSRTRSSSSSSQRSASPGHRSMSAGQRSSHGRSGTTATAANANRSDHAHNAPPWSSGRDGSFSTNKGDMVGRKQRHGSSSGQERSTGKSPGSSRPPTSVRGSPSHPPMSKMNHAHTSHPQRRSPGTQPGKVPNHTGVSKETVSRTHHGFEQRHEVGRKHPRHRISKDVQAAMPVKSSSTGLSECSSSSDSDASDDDGDVTIRNPPQPITNPPAANPPIGDPASHSPSESSSGSESESSSSSDSDSDNEGDDVPRFQDPVPQPHQVSWKLGDLGAESKQSTQPGFSGRSPKSELARNTGPSKPRSSNFHVSKNSFSPFHDQNTSLSVTVQPSREGFRDQQRTQSNKKRKSAPEALTPNPCDVKPHIAKQSPRSSSKSPRSQNHPWGNTSSNPSTVNTNQSTNFAKKGRNSSVSSDKNSRYHSNPHDCKGANTVDTITTMSPPNKHSSVPPGQESYPPLWVSIKAMLLRKDLAPAHKRPPPGPHNKNYPQQRCPTTVSTGSETDQPIRRADNVQVAVADGSTDWDANTSSTKRKLNAESHYEDNRSMQSLSNSNKRIKRDKSGSNQSSPAANTSSPWRPDRTPRKKTPPDDPWREPPNSGGFPEQNLGHQRTRHPNHPDGYHSNRTPNHPHNADGYHNNRTPGNDGYHDNRPPSSRTQSRQESPTSNNPSCQPPVLPDSSVPEQEKEMQTSDWYMREGKRMKHEGDGLASSRTGRTRPGEALSRALAYFEAAMFFIMSGYVMEADNFAERSDTGSNSGSSSTSHSPTNMYQQTVDLLDFVLKMRPHVEQEDKVFKRIMISCVRCQALLYFRIFKLKKDIATKYSDLLNDQFKNMSKSNRTPSPWDHNANTAPNVLSPMSPAVPSPFGHPGPSPVSSNGEQVSSSTQAGKMTPPSHTGLVLPQKTYDMYRQHHAIMRNLLLAHEKWDQGETMLEGHTDFFRNIDTLCNRTLNFHTSLRDVFQYHKVVLHQLRTIPTNSPHE